MEETGAAATAHDAAVVTGAPIDKRTHYAGQVEKQKAKVEKFKGLLAQAEAGLASAEADLARLEG
jgi:hypothetical protein